MRPVVSESSRAFRLERGRHPSLALVTPEACVNAMPLDGLTVEFAGHSPDWPRLTNQGQANRYIKNMGKDPMFSTNGIDVIKLTDKNFLRTLENGIRFGRWVLLENVQVSSPVTSTERFVFRGESFLSTLRVSWVEINRRIMPGPPWKQMEQKMNDNLSFRARPNGTYLAPKATDRAATTAAVGMIRLRPLGGTRLMVDVKTPRGCPTRGLGC